MKRKLLLFICLALQLAIYADPVEIDLSSGSYTGNFTQGQSYTVTGLTDFSGWYVDPDFFTVSINNNLVFRAASGVYKVTADLSGHSIVADRIWDGGDGDAHWTYKEAYNPDTKQGAIWLTGADGSIGLPAYTTGTEWNHVYCVPQVATNIFEITLTVGTELNAANVNFKFRGTPYDSGKDFKGSDGSTYKISTTSTVFGVGTGTDGHNDGNIYLKDGQTLTAGDTYKFRLDCTNAYNIQLTVQKMTVPVSPTPSHAAGQVLSVFSDSYVNQAGKQRVKYKQDNDSYQIVAEKTFAGDAGNKYYEMELNGGWAILRNTAVVDASKYDYLHVDLYRQYFGDGDNEFYVYPRSQSDKPEDTDPEGLAAFANQQATVTEGQWVSVDIPLNDKNTTYKGYMEQMEQLLITGAGKGVLAVDNIYFWRNEPADPVTVDVDGKGINWDSTTGTTCYFDRLVWETFDNRVRTSDATFARAHDGNNLTYHTITREELNGNEHAQMLLQLTKPIRVSDVELVWANGFPKTYKVYAFEQLPVVGSSVPAELLTADNLLFEINDKMLSTDPSIETQSNLHLNVAHNSQYILIDMTARGEGDTFGYYLAEAHVGAYDDDYNTPDHLGVPDYEILTDVDQTLEVTVRNKRNAVLPGVAYREGSVTTSWMSPQLKKRNNQETVVYATSQGVYTITVNGELANGTPLQPGTAVITVDKNWKPEGDFKSIVQQVYEQHKNSEDELNQLFTASRTENGYKPSKVGDGKEASDDILSRWSSFDNTDGSGSIPWDGTAESANRRKEWNKNQYLLINLEKVYELTNIELIWERGYSPEYSVYGFETGNLPTTELLNQDYATFATAYSSHLLYSGNNSEADIAMYPLHDEHSNLSTEGAIREDNRTQYLLIKMNEPAMQSNDYFGFSLWEVYAWGADLTKTDNVEHLATDNISVKAGQEGVVTVKAFGGTQDSGTGSYEYEEDEWHPVAFSTVEKDYFIKKVEERDEESGTTLERYYIYKGEDQVADATDANLVAIITDNNNGTYGIVAAKRGNGQQQGQYDNGVTDGSADDVSFTIQMTSTNTKGDVIGGQFELVVYKTAMALLTNGGSTAKNQVYDDGYFDLNVLKANANRETNTVDLRNVDFTTDNDGNSLANVTIPAPHTVKSNSGTQMNPNTIYYTDESGLNGAGNLAVKQGDGTWRVAALRIFDGWDWAPLTNEGGMVAGQAYFYTSLKAQQYSFIAMPFVPTFASLNDKQVKLYKPIAYSPRRQVVQIDEMTAADFASGFEGKPYVIRTENENLYKANGYGVVFKSNGEVSVVYHPQTWQDAAHGAAITSSYVRKDLTTLDYSQTDYYLFSSAYEMFLPVGNDKLEDDQYNAENKTLSATDVMPFYAYLALDKAQTAGNEVKRVSFFLGQLPADDQDDELTTGIDKLMQEGRVDIYDLQGRRVGCELGSSVPSGIYIVKYSNGETRKINIRK